ncbi:hypothetical protein [Robbsia andropogonis]|uniref:hypothetical protein n=1 Tax=Robbsia andropogonis TaxID=28092 RepID=UPI0020A20827|nr:hypothetical protein [Robbsia andropogonis]MCP1120502.1 hypothetical protein [Robbsia andropogonis]MCP1131283.1 hypothetical protein [Robbsia andropogonis]
MKVSRLSKNYDQTFRPDGVVNQERLSFEAFKQIHGGGPLSQDSLPKIAGLPDGFSVWRTERGELMAIRDE